MREMAARLSDRFLRVGISAFILIPALAWFGASSEKFTFPKTVAGEVVYLAVGILGGLFILVSRVPQSGWSRPVALMVNLPLCALWTSLAAAHSHHSATEAVQLEEAIRLSLLWAFLIGAWSFRPSPWRFASLILFAGGLNATLAITQAAGLTEIWQSAWEGRNVIYGTFGNANLLAEYLVPCAVLAFGYSLASRSPSGGLIAAGSAVLFLVIVLLTETRAAWLGLFAGLAVLAAAGGLTSLVPTRIRRILAVALAVPVIVVLAWSPLRNRVILGASGEDPGVITRSFMWKVAGEMIKDNPILGVGPGGYRLQYLEYAARLQESGRGRPLYAGVAAHAHCDPLELAAEYGLVGAGAFAVFFALLLARAIQGIREASGAARIVRGTGLGVFAAVLVESAVGFPLSSFPTATLMLWGLACATPPAAMRPRPLLRPWVAVVGLALVGAGTLGMGAMIMHGFAADAYLAAGRDGKAPWLERGLMLSPNHGELHFRLGIARLGEKRLDEAAADFERALPVFPDPDVRFNLGYISLQKKDYAKAEEWFREGLRRYPFFKPAAWADFAVALAGQGRRDEARAAAERALAIDPGYGRARVFIMELDKKGRGR